MMQYSCRPTVVHTWQHVSKAGATHSLEHQRLQVCERPRQLRQVPLAAALSQVQVCDACTRLAALDPCSSHAGRDTPCLQCRTARDPVQNVTALCGRKGGFVWIPVVHGAQLTHPRGGTPGKRQGAAISCSASVASNRGGVSDRTAASQACRSCLQVARSAAVICGAHASSPRCTTFSTISSTARLGSCSRPVEQDLASEHGIMFNAVLLSSGLLPAAGPRCIYPQGIHWRCRGDPCDKLTSF